MERERAGLGGRRPCFFASLLHDLPFLFTDGRKEFFCSKLSSYGKSNVSKDELGAFSHQQGVLQQEKGEILGFFFKGGYVVNGTLEFVFRWLLEYCSMCPFFPPIDMEAAARAPFVQG